MVNTYEKYLFDYVSSFPMYYGNNQLKREPFEGGMLVRPISEEEWQRIYKSE